MKPPLPAQMSSPPLVFAFLHFLQSLRLIPPPPLLQPSPSLHNPNKFVHPEAVEERSEF